MPQEKLSNVNFRGRNFFGNSNKTVGGLTAGGAAAVIDGQKDIIGPRLRVGMADSIRLGLGAVAKVPSINQKLAVRIARGFRWT